MRVYKSLNAIFPPPPKYTPPTEWIPFPHFQQPLSTSIPSAPTHFPPPHHALPIPCKNHNVIAQFDFSAYRIRHNLCKAIILGRCSSCLSFPSAILRPGPAAAAAAAASTLASPFSSRVQLWDRMFFLIHSLISSLTYQFMM